MNRGTKGGLALLAAAVCGAAVTVAVRGTPAPAAPSPPPATTATVQRTDLASTVLAAGTLGYTASPPVINRLVGTYTSVLPSGTVVQPGQTLYRVDNGPVVLMSGDVPAWRPFSPGMTDGPDVQELEANLIALGDARGLLSAAGPHYGVAAAAAVARWQASLGTPATGTVQFGAIAFVPAALRIDTASVAPGEPAAPGDQPYLVTTTVRSASVPLTPNDPVVAVGQDVSIQLPSGATTSGRVTAVGPAPPSGPASPTGSSSPAQQSSTASANSATSTVLTVTPDDPATTGTINGESVQVSLTVQSVRHVLAVPIAALLALAGGGYGLEVVERSGAHVLVRVHTGVFAGGEVEVSGRGFGPGTRVLVAQ